MAQLYVFAPVIAQPVDIVHIGWLTAAADWAALLPAIRRPLVVSCHGSDLRIAPLEDDRYRARVASVFARADLVHCVSDDLAARAIALGADPTKVFVRSWGIDTSTFRPDARDPADVGAPDAQPFRILSVGRLHWVKGYEYALLAIAAVRHAGIDVEYTIIGDAKERDRLPVLTAIRDLDLDRCVNLRGARSREEVLAALRASDVFLVSSVSEGVSTATLEAMAVGLPVVVTDVGGMSEAVTDGVEGHLVAPRDPAAMANALIRLLGDPDRRAAMGSRGRDRVVNDFDSGTAARALQERYRALVDPVPDRPTKAAR